VNAVRNWYDEAQKFVETIEDLVKKEIEKP